MAPISRGGGRPGRRSTLSHRRDTTPADAYRGGAAPIAGAERAPFTVGDWSVHPDRNRIARHGGEGVRLEPRVMDLLVYLADHGGEVLSRDRIVDNVWPEAFVGDDALLTAVSALRKAFGDDPRRPEFIETIPKRGYRLIAASSAAAPSIAVLPLRDLADDDETGFFA